MFTFRTTFSKFKNVPMVNLFKRINFDTHIHIPKKIPNIVLNIKNLARFSLIHQHCWNLYITSYQFLNFEPGILIF